MFEDIFKDKKITVLRIGLLGRGVGDTAFLAEMGADIHVVDDADEEVMKPSVDALAEYKNVRFTFGPYQDEHFTDCDYVLVGAGTPLDLPQLQVAREAGVPLKQSAAWFAEISQIPIMGITGTRGKSTVTHMIHHVLTEVTGESVILGGNIRGVSNLQLLKEVKEDSLAVMELDSWQLQGWGWNKMSPQVAVFTNFMADHLNYYQAGGRSEEEAMDIYFKDKANIFRYQEDSGVFVTTPEVFTRAKTVPDLELGQEVVLVDESAIPKDALLAMPGAHNRLNAAIALEALKAVSLEEEVVFAGLASFPGVPGRLEYLGEVKDIKIYNDNNSTIPQATIKGIEAVGNQDDKNLILIAGGAYKNIPVGNLPAVIEEYCKKVILLPGTGTDLIKDQLKAEVVDNLEAALALAVDSGQPGDVILFSPGFASFGLFKNEYERNDEFVRRVNGLTAVEEK